MKDRGGFARNFALARGLVKLGNEVTLLTTIKSKFLMSFKPKIEIRDGVYIVAFEGFFPTVFLRGGSGLISTTLKILYRINNYFDIVQSDTGQRPASGLPCLFNRMIFTSKYISEWWDF